ncbi:MAG TPA: C40 family peptidase [Woeseiaceae bacterium]|nr:C40 family peptidase [Woeseiaceae bacterium]
MTENRVSLLPAAALFAALVLSACAAAPPASGSRPGTHDAAGMDSAMSGAHHDAGTLAAEVALAQVGQPYRYGGAAPGGFDCSGLVQYAYRRAGLALPRTTGALWSHSDTVSRTELRPGDLLFFSIAGKMQHVGMYLGSGRFVHAPSTGRTVTVESLASGYYATALLRAGRPPQGASPW